MEEEADMCKAATVFLKDWMGENNFYKCLELKRALKKANQETRLSTSHFFDWIFSLADATLLEGEALSVDRSVTEGGSDKSQREAENKPAHNFESTLDDYQETETANQVALHQRVPVCTSSQNSSFPEQATICTPVTDRMNVVDYDEQQALQVKLESMESDSDLEVIEALSSNKNDCPNSDLNISQRSEPVSDSSVYRTAHPEGEIAVADVLSDSVSDPTCAENAPGVTAAVATEGSERTFQSQRRLHTYAWCPHCVKPFSNMGNMRKHIRVVHIKQRNYSCHLCAYKSSESSILKRHLRTHEFPGRNFGSQTRDQQPAGATSQLSDRVGITYPSCS